MNGGICSDSMGQFLRRDGSAVSFEELVGAKPAEDGAAKFVLFGSVLLFGILLIKGIRS